jgi:excisionase family DNA binding protein
VKQKNTKISTLTKSFITADVKQSPLPERVLLRVSEVAQYFDVTERTVYLWIAHGHLKTEEYPGSQIRISKESVDMCRFKKS